MVSQNLPFKKLLKNAQEIIKDNDRVHRLLVATLNKLKTTLENNDKLREFSEKVCTMIRMLKAQFSGKYPEFPWKSLVFIVVALLYFVTPLDLIPDIIPILGLTDDISIVFWIYKSVQGDIEKFIEWEQTIEI